jgi:hypothetical protein
MEASELVSWWCRGKGIDMTSLLYKSRYWVCNYLGGAYIDFHTFQKCPANWHELRYFSVIEYHKEEEKPLQITSFPAESFAGTREFLAMTEKIQEAVDRAMGIGHV